jgi:hypothetical protein
MTHDPDDGLRPLVERLPRSIEPPRDLWPAIAARLDRRPTRQRRWLVALAAAAIIVIAAASSLATAWIIGRGDRAPAVATAGGPREASYLRATAALTAELSARRDELAPETIAVLDRNLEIIDRAIEESRAALAADPANHDLAELLWASYQRKVSFLEQAARLATPT